MRNISITFLVLLFLFSRTTIAAGENTKSCPPASTFSHPAINAKWILSSQYPGYTTVFDHSGKSPLTTFPNDTESYALIIPTTTPGKFLVQCSYGRDRQTFKPLLTSKGIFNFDLLNLTNAINVETSANFVKIELPISHKVVYLCAFTSGNPGYCKWDVTSSS
jgi:hypothetical protein